SLRPDTTYRIAIGDGARSRRVRALDRLIALRFLTATAPSVLALLPADGARDVAIDAPISIRFSRAIVPTTTLALPRELPELRFEPPLTCSATWLHSTHLLLR